jgi:hypothetical protein
MGMDYCYYFVPNPTPEQVRQTYEFLSGISLLFHYKLRKIRDRAKLSLDEMARVVGAESGEEIESYEEANSSRLRKNWYLGLISFLCGHFSVRSWF